MNEENAIETPRIQGLMLAAIMKKMDGIEAKLERKIAFLDVETAVSEFLKHLQSGVSRRGKSFRQPRHYEYLMRLFQRAFKGKNLAELTAEEVQNFLDRTWESAKPSTLKQRQQQLHTFFSWASKYLLKRGSISFPNICDLMTPIAIDIERPDFIPIETMKLLLKHSQMPYKLIFQIMATGGLRVSECVNLRKGDVKGRVITITFPKSGAKSEIAVVPKEVAKSIAVYSYNRAPGERIFKMTDRSVLNAIHSIGYNLDIENLKNHSMRKWCISYWARKSEPEMEAFVSRHSSVKLRERYVAPLSAEEAMEIQKIMEEELYG